MKQQLRHCIIITSENYYNSWAISHWLECQIDKINVLNMPRNYSHIILRGEFKTVARALRSRALLSKRPKITANIGQPPYRPLLLVYKFAQHIFQPSFLYYNSIEVQTVAKRQRARSMTGFANSTFLFDSLFRWSYDDCLCAHRPHLTGWKSENQYSRELWLLCE